MQNQPAGGRAALTGRAERPPQHPFERQIQIGIVHHDHGILPAHFERQPLVHLAARRADRGPCFGRAGERDHRHLGVLDQRATHHRALPVDQLHDLPRQAGFEQYLDEQMRRVRYVLGGLEDHGVPAQQRGEHFPGGDREREIERRDESRDPDRTAVAHRALVPQLRGDHAPEQPAALGRRIKRGVDPFLDVASRLGDDFPHFSRHRARDGILALDQELADALKHLPANRRGRFRPLREAAPGRVDGALQVVRPRAREPADDVVPIGWVAILEVLTRRGGDPIAGNEVLEFRGRSHGFHGSGQKNGTGVLPYRRGNSWRPANPRPQMIRLIDSTCAIPSRRFHEVSALQTPAIVTVVAPMR